MQNFHKIASEQNIKPLLAAIMRQPELWNKLDIRTLGDSYHREADDIILRFNDVFSSEDLVNSHESIDYRSFFNLAQARPIIFDLMRFVEGKRLGRVVITRLSPGQRIYAHTDSVSQTDYYDRYHVTLQNAEGPIFRAGDETICMQPGDIYWFNNAVEHEVINNSYEDRITMIIDICSK